MKLIIASNRLPLSISREKNTFKYRKSAGGLVTGIESLSKTLDFVWYGNISGMNLTEGEKKLIEDDCWTKFKSVPVFIENELNSLCYDGFCNAILWPTIHSFPDNVCFTYKEYDAYVEFNRIFAEKILENAKDGDIVWVHDYHLMLVPKMIKDVRPNIKVMFFLHTAFPDHTDLKPLICVKELLSGIAAADVIAFHIPAYSVNFRCALNAYRIQSTAKIRSISIGIDPEMFRNQIKTEETKKRIEEFKKIYSGKQIVLGVDRTDYIKGMPQRFKGIERYFERNPEKIDKVVFLQVAIPSRLSVVEYSSYVHQINQQIQEVNGKYGDINKTPIKMLFSSVEFNELCALYAVADAVLITSITDGMNLVALEYIACQDENKGSVILSKFAGALGTIPGCISHKSTNTEEIAEAIEIALNMSAEERSKRHLINKNGIDNFTSIGWAEQNLKIISQDWENEVKKFDKHTPMAFNQNNKPIKFIDNTNEIKRYFVKSEGSRRMRLKLHPEQIRVLEINFQVDDKPSASTKSYIANALGLPLKNVQIWFQNRRAKAKSISEDGNDLNHTYYNASNSIEEPSNYSIENFYFQGDQKNSNINYEMKNVNYELKSSNRGDNYLLQMPEIIPNSINNTMIQSPSNHQPILQSPSINYTSNYNSHDLQSNFILNDSTMNNLSENFNDESNIIYSGESSRRRFEKKFSIYENVDKLGRDNFIYESDTKSVLDKYPFNKL